MRSKKVFCNECEFLRVFRYENSTWAFPYYKCSHLKNVASKNKGNWLSKETIVTQYEKDPSAINQNNDCKWFKKKEVKDV